MNVSKGIDGEDFDDNWSDSESGNYGASSDWYDLESVNSDNLRIEEAAAVVVTAADVNESGESIMKEKVVNNDELIYPKEVALEDV